ncbi:MAG TPA: hypothetical protein VFV99_00940 [Kofleriaceae bacterium]|nr:hypothetical protein [Kofleriaceae bacterium]
MRWGALLVAYVLAGCNSGTGVDIDIYAPDGVKVDRVELWIAYDQCGDCPNGVAWNDKERTSGGIYFLRDEALIRAEPRPDRFVIHLDAKPGFEDPAWITFVGYDGDKVTAIKALQPEDNTFIPTSEVVIWKMDLHPADVAINDVDTPPPTDHNWRGLVWNRAPTSALAEPTGCLVYQKWDGAAWRTDYLVPKTDPDCDGIPPEKECSDFWYQYKPNGSCVSSMTPMFDGTCVIGRSPCADGVTSDTTCGLDTARSPTCLPDAFCAYCDDTIPADTCIEHAVEQGYANAVLPHYDCGFDATPEGTPCLDQHATLQLPYVLSACGTIQMHTLDKPFTEPQSSLTFGVAPDAVTFMAKLRTSTSEPCVVDVYWTGGITDTFKDGITFLLEVPYDNGTRAMYPVNVQPTGNPISCPNQPLPLPCLVDGPTNDNVITCAASG